MKLKHYQEKVLTTLKDYLSHLTVFKDKYEKMLAIDADIARSVDFPKLAWEKTTNKPIYHTKVNGLNEPLPDVYLKVPTGGGKTILACHAIDLIYKGYLKKQTGLVLWIVPSNQIYRQTISSLKNRAHPYRQILDISSGGRVLLKEKTDLFTKQDTEENLVILLLMLPSANRQNKETLKVFKDSGGFTDFFPSEDNYPAQEALLKAVPNLDCFKTSAGIFDTQIKTSLGNTLKLLKPLIIIDEGHRAYGENARNTIKAFNPSFVLELSATPPPNCNKLVEITGRELNDEEMIKLDIHLINKTSLDWKDTMLASIERRNLLEDRALAYEGNTGIYIRPICLIQVERTGTDPNDPAWIHAEHVKEFLLKNCNIPLSHIAIKSSQSDDIEGIDLFSKTCDIRYIITKQALQEGWDCSFASVLTILTNPGSTTSITQLIGRILRQPFGRKTQIKELDECYVFTFKQNATALVREIKSGLEDEGLGDLSGRIVNDEGAANNEQLKEHITKYRSGFKKFEGKIYLPKFVIQEKECWRDLNFDADILQHIDWKAINVDEIAESVLSGQAINEQELSISLGEEESEFLTETGRLEKRGNLKIDAAFMAQQIAEIIPNPWVGYEMVQQAIKILLNKYNDETIASNIIFIIEELKKILIKERDKLAEQIFKRQIKDKNLFFFLIADNGFHLIPSHIKVQSNKQLIRNDNSPLQNSLFDYVPEEGINELEKSVAIYLDQQEKLLWWYRNISKQHYHIQGWKRNKIYPDFIAVGKDKEDETDYSIVYVLETKGIHLAKNEDTTYKQNVFSLCNELALKRTWQELFNDFPDHNFEFQVVMGDEWQNKINQL